MRFASSIRLRQAEACSLAGVIACRHSSAPKGMASSASRLARIVHEAVAAPVVGAAELSD